MLRHDRRGTLRFAPQQGTFGRAVLARHPTLAGVDSVIWLRPASGSTGESAATRSDAALNVFEYLGGWWRWLTVARVIPRPLRDAVYDVVASHRHRVTRQQCLLPDAAARHRFLD